MPTGKWYGPFWEGGIYWFSKDILDFYCANITQIDLIKNRCEDKLFSDIIRNCTKIKAYEGDICFMGYPNYKNFKQIGFGEAKVNLSCYNNSTVISNLKQENQFKFFADCFMKDEARGDGELFKLIKINDRLSMAEYLLNKYRTAEIVITTRLHCILPCRAFNTNAIFIHKNYKSDPRFSGLKNIINGDSILTNNINIDRNELETIRQKFMQINL